MSRHTFICSAGRRIDVQPDKFTPGLIRIQILSANREILGSITIDPAGAAVLAQALQIEAEAVEPGLGRDAIDAADTACEASSAHVRWDIGPIDKKALLSKESLRVIEKARLEDEMYARQLDKIRTDEIFGGVAL